MSMLLPDGTAHDETFHTTTTSVPFSEPSVGEHSNGHHRNGHNGHAGTVNGYGAFNGHNGHAVALTEPLVTNYPAAAEAGTLPYLGWQRHLKRGLDITASLLGIIVLLPIGLLVMLAILLSSPGNPFFAQRRVGRNGRQFPCVKFRTMHTDAEARLQRDPELYAEYVNNDFKLPAGKDPRVSAVGRFLRRTSLDELPQLVNVLLGHMSLVGPRPVVPPELESYGPWRAAYLTLRPGITGVWQINGRSQVRYPERAQLDAQYLDDWTFRTDVAILLKTIPSVIRRHGAH